MQIKPVARLSLLSVLSSCLLLLASTSWAQVPDKLTPAIDKVLHLTEQRLGLAVQVAQSKWHSGKLIDDPGREAAILDQLTSQANAAKVSPDLLRDYFQAQFDASKTVQQQLFKTWKTLQLPVSTPAPDLKKDVRPALDRLTPDLVNALAGLQPVLKENGARSWIDERAKLLMPMMTQSQWGQQALAPLLRHAHP